MSVTETTPEQFLKQLPSAASLRDRLREHREQGKVLRRLLKLAAASEAVQELNPCSPLGQEAISGS